MAFSIKPTKQYGLLMPKKKEAGLKKSNVFGDDSDEEDPHAAVNTDIKRQALQAKVKRQTQMEIDKALQQDPTVYDYDTIYDSLKADKEEKNQAVKQKAEKKPRYIQGLMKAAEQRKREDERRQERKVQKEREKEGGEFDDKDVFITGAYRKKMQEMQELEEKERREAEMEALLDVKNQKDMTGFYRYLLRETTGDPQPGENPAGDSQPGENAAEEIKIKQEKEDSETEFHIKNTNNSREEGSSSSEECGNEESYHSRKKDSYSHRSQEGSRTHRDRSNSRERVRGEGHSRKDRKRSRSKDRETTRRKKDRSRSRDRKRSRSKERVRKRSRSTERDSDRNRYSNVSSNKSEERHRRKEDNNVKSSKTKYDNRKRESDDRDSIKEEKTKRRNIEEQNEEEEAILPQPPPSEEASTQDLESKKSDTGSETKYAKKTSESDADAARRRYLERKLAKERARLAHQQD